jgi:hypothetical protein
MSMQRPSPKVCMPTGAASSPLSRSNSPTMWAENSAGPQRSRHPMRPAIDSACLSVAWLREVTSRFRPTGACFRPQDQTRSQNFRHRATTVLRERSLSGEANQPSGHKAVVPTQSGRLRCCEEGLDAWPSPSIQKLHRHPPTACRRRVPQRQEPVHSRRSRGLCSMFTLPMNRFTRGRASLSTSPR